MCFNPAKSWKLAWYDGQYETHPGTQGKTYKLNGVVHHNKNDSSRTMVVKLVSGDEANFYVGFNRATGFNAGTKEAANQVTVVAAEDKYKSSVLVGKLSPGDWQDFATNQGTMIVRFRSLTNGNKDAIVDVFKQGCDPLQGCGVSTPNPTPQPTPQPTPSPTPNPTPQPTPQPTGGSPNSGNCGNRASLVVETKLDEYGDLDNSWKVVWDQTGNTVGAVNSFPRRSQTYNNEICLKRGESYTFYFYDDYGDALCCKYGEGYYKVYLDGQLIFQGDDDFKFKVEEKFDT